LPTSLHSPPPFISARSTAYVTLPPFRSGERWFFLCVPVPGLRESSSILLLDNVCSGPSFSVARALTPHDVFLFPPPLFPLFQKASKRSFIVLRPRDCVRSFLTLEVQYGNGRPTFQDLSPPTLSTRRKLHWGSAPLKTQMVCQV